MKKQKKKPLLGILVFILVLCAIGGFFLAREHNAFIHFGEKEIEVIGAYEYDNENKATFNTLNGNIISCSRDGISMITKEDKLIWDKTLNIKNPKMIKQDNYIAVGDINGKELFLFNKEGFIHRYSFSYPIIQFDVNTNGYIAVLLEQNKKHSLEIYDNKGTIIAERVTYFDNDGYPIGFDLSNDGISLVTSYLNLKNNTTQSNITFFDFSTNGKEYEEQIQAAFIIEESIVPEIKFLGEDHLIAVGDNKILFYKTSPKPQCIKEIALEHEIKKLAFNDKETYIIYEGDVASNRQDLMEIYNLTGSMIYTKEFPHSIHYLNVDKESFYIGTDIFLKKFSKNGTLQWEYTLKKDIKQVYSLKHDYIMVYQNDYEIIKIR